MTTLTTSESEGLNLYSASFSLIYLPPNGGLVSIPTHITTEPPEGTYVQIVSRSSISFKHSIHVASGVIDPDYRSNIKSACIIEEIRSSLSTEETKWHN